MKKVSLIIGMIAAMTTILFNSNVANAQEEKSSPLGIGVDLMSRYVWRGLDYGASPSIQPYIELGLGNFSFGAWGAYTTNLPGVQEMDLYATYTFADMITVGVTDYFFPDEILGYDYYETRLDSSGHVVEGMVSFNGLENLPLSFMAGVNLYNDSQNSVYFELGYSFSIMDLFVGAGNGIYTTDGDFGLVNLGIGVSKEVAITEKFALPLSASLITNPEAKQIHLVFGVSF